MWAEEEVISLAFLKDDVEKGDPRVGLGASVGAPITFKGLKSETQNQGGEKGGEEGFPEKGIG